MVRRPDGIKQMGMCISGLFDTNDTLWVVDPAAPEMKKVRGEGAKLVSVDLKTDAVIHIYKFTHSIWNTPDNKEHMF
jgi:hypothetical protein